MKESLSALLRKFLIWKYKHISERNFVFMLSALMGLVAGLISVLIKNITYVIAYIADLGLSITRNGLYFILPTLGLFGVYLIVERLYKKGVFNPIPTVLYALSKRGGKLSGDKFFFPLITAPLTAGFGGSVGLLSPTILSASAASSAFGDLFHLNRKTRQLLIACAASGVIATSFQSPIAAVVFAIEIFSLDLTFASLLPLLIASLVSVITSFFFVGDEVLFKVILTSSFSVNDTPLYLALGLFAGLVSVYFHKVHFAVTGFFARIKSKGKRVLIGGLFIGGMLYAIPPLYGEGFSVINNLLEANHQSVIEGSLMSPWADNTYVIIGLLLGITLFKSVVMTVTIAAGGTGGIIIPALVMGSALGNAVAKLINTLGWTDTVSEANFTLVGMAAIVAGVLQAPLTAIFLIAEITGGYELFIPLMLAVSMAYMITKNSLDHTIYTKELAEKDALLSFDKDQSVLTLMSLDTVIETNFVVLRSDMTFRELLQQGVAQSSRNLFPVVDDEGQLVGIILLDDIRPFLFDQSVYDSTYVKGYMNRPPDIIHYEKDSMQKVMQRFQDSGAWNLPVLKAGKYVGFVSKSKLLTAYRRELINFTN
ncbi:MAG: hypothetical protein RLZZ242_606 [Bacteroidota bacterium]